MDYCSAPGCVEGNFIRAGLKIKVPNEVQYDPGAKTEAARLRRGLREGFVLSPGGPVRRDEASGGLDFFRPPWKGSSSQVGERHGDGACF